MKPPTACSLFGVLPAVKSFGDHKCQWWSTEGYTPVLVSVNVNVRENSTDPTSALHDD